MAKFEFFYVCNYCKKRSKNRDLYDDDPFFPVMGISVKCKDNTNCRIRQMTKRIAKQFGDLTHAQAMGMLAETLREIVIYGDSVTAGVASDELTWRQIEAEEAGLYGA